MSIRVKVDEEQYEEYPVLKINRPVVVLFDGPGRGVALVGSLTTKVGQYKDTWIEDRFETFKGDITLHNE